MLAQTILHLAMLCFVRLAPPLGRPARAGVATMDEDLCPGCPSRCSGCPWASHDDEPVASVSTEVVVGSVKPTSQQQQPTPSRAPAPRLCLASEPAQAPTGIHPGVLCDKTMNPIVGYRFTRSGSNPSYDLCQAEFDKLPPEEQQRFDRFDPPITPRRALLFVVAAAVAGRLAFGSSSPPRTPPREDLEDFEMLPPLSPAEELVGLIFRAPPPRAGAAECDDECKQRIADRRKLFELSRTNTRREDVLALSRQRAAMYNTTFQGASCIPGVPCI